MKKNGKIELLRFVFATMIVLSHFKSYVQSVGGLFTYASLGVEFFFILSGYLMASSLSKPAKEYNLLKDTFQFLKRKVVALIPTYVVGYVLVFASYSIFSGKVKNLHDLIVLAVKNIPGFLTFSDLAVTSVFARVDGVTWYIPAMLLGMAVLYPLCRKSSAFRKYAVPVIGFILLFYLALKFHSLVTPRDLAFGGLIYKGYVRAFCELCLGILTYDLTVNYVNKLQLTAAGEKLIHALELFSFAFVMFVHIFTRRGVYNFPALLMIMALVSLCFSKYSWQPDLFNNNVCAYLGRLALSVFLSHYTIMYAFKYDKPDFFVRMPMVMKITVYLLLTYLVAILVDLFCQTVTKRKKS